MSDKNDSAMAFEKPKYVVFTRISDNRRISIQFCDHCNIVIGPAGYMHEAKCPHFCEIPEIKPFGVVDPNDGKTLPNSLPPRQIKASDILTQRMHSPAPPPGGRFPGLKDIWDQVNEKQRQDEAPAILSDDEAAHALLGVECTDVERKVRLLKKAGFCICKEKSGDGGHA